MRSRCRRHALRATKPVSPIRLKMAKDERFRVRIMRAKADQQEMCLSCSQIGMGIAESRHHYEWHDAELPPDREASRREERLPTWLSVDSGLAHEIAGTCASPSPSVSPARH